MDVEWKFVEMAGGVNLVLGAAWKMHQIVKEWIINIVDARLASQGEKFAGKQEVQEIHEELRNLIDKHVH